MFEWFINSDIGAPIYVLCIFAAVAAAVFGFCWLIMKAAKVPGVPSVILGLILAIGGAVVAGFHGAVIGLLIGVFVAVFSMANRQRPSA